MKLLSTRVRRIMWLTALLLFGIYLIFSHKYQFLYNEGRSMEPTYQNGEWIVMQRKRSLRKNWQPNRYDVVAINDSELLIKRVLALGGETIEIKKGQLYINKKLYEDPYGRGKISFLLKFPSNALVETGITEKEIRIPKGHVWLIGDNRPYSWYGTLSIEDVRGLVVF